MCDRGASYYHQFRLCGPLGPALTSNKKFFAPSNPVYVKPFSTYVYPVQQYRFKEPGTYINEFLIEKNEPMRK